MRQLATPRSYVCTAHGEITNQIFLRINILAKILFAGNNKVDFWEKRRLGTLSEYCRPKQRRARGQHQSVNQQSEGGQLHLEHNRSGAEGTNH